MAIRLTVQYIGTRYHGFQRQAPGIITVQTVLEEVLGRLMGPGSVVGGSRTDSRVHAAGQVVVWHGPCLLPLDRLTGVLNRRLPPDIQVYDPRPVPDNFDPRRAASAKAYSYRIWRPERPAVLPWSQMSWHCSKPLSFRIMQAASRLFEGEHDFWAFRAEGSSARTTVRTVLSSRWEMEAEGRIWTYRVVATGFLYHMVRIMVGGMMRCGTRDSVEPVALALQHPRRYKLGTLVPPEGLTLDWIAFNGE